MRLLGILRVELLVLVALVAVGLIIWISPDTTTTDKLDHEVIASDDLEPFRSAFNAAEAHVRAVLLAGPT